MASANKTVLFGLYSDDDDLKRACKKAVNQHLDMDDVYTPFPVHGLDPILGLKESRLHYLGFIYGATGCLLAFGLMSWIFTRDWPIIFGGKPFWSVPAFIPMTFESTVMLASVGMTFTFYTICGLWPGMQPKILHDRLTDDKFAITFDVTNADSATADKYRAFLTATGAEEIQTKSHSPFAILCDEIHHFSHPAGGNLRRAVPLLLSGGGQQDGPRVHARHGSPGDV